MNRIFFICIALLLLNSCKKDNPPVEIALYFPPAGSDLWETVTPASLGWNESQIPALLDLLKNNGTRAFIILKDGKIVIEEYFGNNLAGTALFNKNTNWYWASAGKTLTAFTVGKAQEEGFLKITNKSTDYLGSGWTTAGAAKEALITVKHQLTMTTGLDDGVTDNHSTLPQDLKYKADAGTRWAYHNGAYTLLEKVVKTAVSEDFELYFNSVLRDKINMDGFWAWSDNDHVYYSTARSMARFGLLMLNKGKWGTETIMNDNDYFSAMITPSQTINNSYGYLWWLNGKASFMMPESQVVFPGSYAPNGPADMFSGLGKNGQYVSIIPSKKYGSDKNGGGPFKCTCSFYVSG